jgi:hypothetical protein
MIWSTSWQSYQRKWRIHHSISYILLTAWVHSGETQESWSMQGCINFLMSYSPQASFPRARLKIPDFAMCALLTWFMVQVCRDSCAHPEPIRRDWWLILLLLCCWRGFEQTGFLPTSTVVEQWHLAFSCQAFRNVVGKIALRVQDWVSSVIVMGVWPGANWRLAEWWWQ